MIKRILITSCEEDKSENLDFYCHGNIVIQRTDKISSVVSSFLSFSTKILLTRKFRKKHKFLSLLISIFLKRYSWIDEIGLVVSETIDYDVIYIPHNRLLNSIIGFHLSKFEEMNSRIYTIPLERVNTKQQLISKLHKFLISIGTRKKHTNSPLIVCGNCADLTFLSMLRKSYPNAVIVDRFYDDLSEDVMRNVGNLPDFIEKLKKINIVLETYNKKDADFYSIRYQPNYVAFPIDKYENQLNKIVFIGSSQGRFELLLKIAYTVHQIGYIVEFLFSDSLNQVNKSKIESFESYAGYKAFKDEQFLTYEDYYAKIEKSDIIIDLFRLHPDEGYSYRIGEALSQNKLIITNRVNILHEPFYNENKIFVITDNIEELQKFILNKNKNIKYNSTNMFNIGNYIMSMKKLCVK